MHFSTFPFFFLPLLISLLLLVRHSLFYVFPSHQFLQTESRWKGIGECWRKCEKERVTLIEEFNFFLSHIIRVRVSTNYSIIEFYFLARCESFCSFFPTFSLCDCCKKISSAFCELDMTSTICFRSNWVCFSTKDTWSPILGLF